MSQISNFIIKNLSFRFKHNDCAFFQGLSFSCKLHRMNLLQGANGTGKSTLLRLLLGNVNALEVLEGMCIAGDKSFNLALKNDRAILRNFMSYVPQNANLLLADNLTVYQTIQMASLARYPTFGFLPKDANRHQLLQKLTTDLNQAVSRLSGGQRQLLAIISALQKTTQVLLLDEPTAALDQKNTTLVMDFITHLVATTSIAVIMVNHNQEIARNCANAEYLRLMVDEVTGRRVLSF